MSAPKEVTRVLGIPVEVNRAVPPGEVWIAVGRGNCILLEKRPSMLPPSFTLARYVLAPSDGPNEKAEP